MAQECGIRVVIATGRMFRAALPHARTLAITDPLITYQGALVRDPNTFETWWHHCLPEDTTAKIVKLVQDLGIHLNLYRQDRLLVERLTPECDWYTALAQVEAEVVESFADQLKDVTKLVAIAPPGVLDAHQDRLHKALRECAYVVRSTPRYLEFGAPGVSKATALSELASRFGIPPDAVVAFGDADNDAEMLSSVGFGVSVGSASLAARRSAKLHVALEDGVAQIVEAIAYAQARH